MQIDENNLKGNTSKEYFSAQFRKALEKWKARGGWTDEMFASQCGITREMVRRYKYGKALPQPNTIKRMCAVLSVKPEFFAYKDPIQIYRYSSDHTKEQQVSLDSFAQLIGLDPNFVSFIFNNNLITENDVWRPLVLPKYAYYKRMDVLETKAFKDEALYIVKRSEDPDTALLCSENDLRIMKGLQSAVQTFISTWYAQQRARWDEETAEANKQATTKDDKGAEVVNELPFNSLVRIDPLMMYTKEVRYIRNTKEAQDGKH